jgi:hypothetical protein
MDTTKNITSEMDIVKPQIFRRKLESLYLRESESQPYITYRGHHGK